MQPSDSSGSDSDQPNEDGEGDSETLGPGLFEIPAGLVRIDQLPAVLDASLVGWFIMMKFAPGKATNRCPKPDPGGWMLGKLKRRYDQSTPTLFKKYDYLVSYIDGEVAQKLPRNTFMMTGDKNSDLHTILHPSLHTPPFTPLPSHPSLHTKHLQSTTPPFTPLPSH